MDKKYEKNYEAELSSAIEALFEKVKQTPLDDRIELAEDVIEDYLEKTGRKPGCPYLSRLSNYVLYDILYDKTPWKVRNTEFPIFNDYLYEAKSKLDTNMSSYDKQLERGVRRRQRTKYENSWSDREVKTRNELIRNKYNAFKKGKGKGILNIVISNNPIPDGFIIKEMSV